MHVAKLCKIPSACAPVYSSTSSNNFNVYLVMFKLYILNFKRQRWKTFYMPKCPPVVFHQVTCAACYNHDYHIITIILHIRT